MKVDDLCKFNTTNGLVKLLCKVPGSDKFWVVEWINSKYHINPYAVINEDWLTPV